MATLQRFKLLAMQCGVAQSPTRSPRTSPVVHLRRRKTTLKMLLNRRSPNRREQPAIQHHRLATGLPEKNQSVGKEVSSKTLNDLFVTSPPIKEDGDEQDENKRGNGKTKEEVLALVAKLNEARACAGSAGEPSSIRPLWFGFRKRLARGAWRPMLGTIPE